MNFFDVPFDIQDVWRNFISRPQVSRMLQRVKPVGVPRSSTTSKVQYYKSGDQIQHGPH